MIPDVAVRPAVETALADGGHFGHGIEEELDGARSRDSAGEPEIGAEAAAPTVLVAARTGQVHGAVHVDEVERSRLQPDGIVSSIAQLPEWLEQNA